MNYKNKYIKYKNKYLRLKNQKGNGHTKWQAKLLKYEITSKDIAFGTDGITDQEIISKAIDTGYLLFDTAQSYGNIEMIAKVIEEKNSREKIFIIYKILLPLSKNMDFNNFMKYINNAINVFKYIDCLMFHEESQYVFNKFDFDDEELNKQMNKKMKKIEEEIIKVINNKEKIKSFGLSNVFISEKLIEKYKKFGITISFIENKINVISIKDINLEKQKNILEKYNIKLIGYGAFGEKNFGYCGSDNINLAQPQIYYDAISHPIIFNLAKEYNVDVNILILAYLAKKTSAIQISSSRNMTRIVDNYKFFNKSYKVLDEKSIEIIDNSLGGSFISANDFIKEISDYDVNYDIPYKLFSWKSRKRIYDYLKNKNHIIVDIISYVASKSSKNNVNMLFSLYYLLVTIMEFSFKEHRNINESIFKNIYDLIIKIKDDDLLYSFLRELVNKCARNDNFVTNTCDTLDDLLKCLMNFINYEI